MKMAELVRFGFPNEIVDLWRQRESEDLLPLQEMAIRQFGLFDDRNLLLQAPTTSGKTFVGEMAAIHAALQRQKAVYLVPLKALAREKWLDFREKYAPYGINVIVSTRDFREFDADLERGRYDIAMVVYEKLSQLLVRRPERFQELGVVVADELEILSDPERGAGIEVLLTHILRSGIRLVGLSAVVGQPERLADWMEAGLVRHERRPVELRYGVLHEGVFRYRTYNDFGEAREELVDCVAESSTEILMENIAAFVDRGEPCIVFVKDRYESRRGADLLCRSLSLPAATQAIAALRSLEPTHSRDVLIELLSNGVAFHNADLTPEERRVVEEAFRAGEVQALVSTSTLAVGMNLPAQNVFITTDKWQYDNRFGTPWKAPILRAEYENMGGRAGRYGTGKSFGRAILIARSRYDEETLWRRYVEGEREPIAPQLGRQPLEDHVLRLVASCACRTLEELVAFIERTLTGRWVWAATLSPEETVHRVRCALDRLIEAILVGTNPDGRLEATHFGAAVAAKGITVQTAREVADWVRVSESRVWHPLDLLLAVALTPNGRMFQVPLTMREYEEADYPGRLRRKTAAEDIAVDVPLNRIRTCTLTPFFEEVRAIKVSLFLLDWIDEHSVYDIEEEYHALCGQILAAAEQMSWLLDATAAVADALGASEPFVERVRVFAERVLRGLREESLAFVRSGAPELPRPAVMALVGQGLDDPQALIELAPEQLERWMGPDEARRLHEWAARRSGESQESALPPHERPPVLVVDDRRPAQIIVDGKAVELQEKQYRLIRLLAETPGACVPYDSIYDCLWGETVVEPDQMHFQKRRLLQAITEAVPGRRGLIRTIAKRGFVLELDPHEVRLQTMPKSA